MYKEMRSRYRKSKIEKRKRFKNQLEKINTENELEDSNSARINSSSIGDSENINRATFIFENFTDENSEIESDTGTDADKDEDDEDINLEDLTFNDKARLFLLLGIFDTLIMFGDALQVIGSIFLSINTQQTVKQAELMLGVGALIAWASLIKYAENAKGYNIITNTIINSSGIILKGMIGVAPLLIA